MSVPTYSNQYRRALCEALQPVFIQAGDAVSTIFAQHGISTSARRLAGNEEIAAMYHAMFGAGVASLVMTVNAFSEDAENHAEATPKDTFSNSAISIAIMIVAARRLGVDMLPLIGAAMAVASVPPSDDADAEQAMLEQSRLVEALYDINSNLPDNIFDGETLFAGYAGAFEDDEDSDEEDGDEDEYEDDEDSDEEDESDD